MSTHQVQVRAKLFRGLSDLSRLRVLDVLRDGPLSVGMIATRAQLSQPNTSMHLACLAECGLVRRERRGKFMHYEIVGKRVVKLLDQADELLLEVGPFIEACRRYRRSTERQETQRPRWRR